MIISASRRTDIPAFFSDWMINRLRSNYCCVVNPFNSKQVTRVSLEPEDVDVILFWTKNPKPLLKYLAEIDSLGYRYYFQYTVNGYPQKLEPNLPTLEDNLETFRQLSDYLGQDRVLWRYDPIVLSSITPYDYHLKKIEEIAQQLKGYTRRLTISFYDEYRAAASRLQRQGIDVFEPETDSTEFQNAVTNIFEIAVNAGLDIYSCAEKYDLTNLGIRPGKCVDNEYINRVFGLYLGSKKDKNQRKECGCVVSKDIGAYDTCLHNCLYCYATKNSRHSKLDTLKNYHANSPSLPKR